MFFGIWRSKEDRLSDHFVYVHIGSWPFWILGMIRKDSNSDEGVHCIAQFTLRLLIHHQIQRLQNICSPPYYNNFHYFENIGITYTQVYDCFKANLWACFLGSSLIIWCYKYDGWEESSVFWFVSSKIVIIIALILVSGSICDTHLANFHGQTSVMASL